MLPRLNAMRGASVHASDGAVGHVADFYFDDESWTVRFAVVDTGSWLSGRAVLLPLAALEDLDWTNRHLRVKPTRDQVRDSPDVDTIRPVSRQMEASALAHYGHPIYWAGPMAAMPIAPPVLMPAAVTDTRPSSTQSGRADDVHLRSCREVSGYHVHTTDGHQGHVDDLLVDPETWTIERLLVDTSNWIGGRWVMVPTRAVRAVDWGTRSFELRLARADVLNSPEVPAGEHPALQRRSAGRKPAS